MPAARTAAVLAALILVVATTARAGTDIRAYDLNGDRFVTYSELVQTAPGATRSDFAAIDANGDRRLSANEFAAPRAQAVVARHAAAPAAPRSQPVRLAPLSVSDVDADGDGRVSFEELGNADTLSQFSLRGN